MRYERLPVHSASAALAAGDVVCIASDAGVRSVTAATPAALAAAGQAHGIVPVAAAPGDMVSVIVEGSVDPRITGLAVEGAELVRVSAGARAENVASYSAGDYPLGSVDANSWLVLSRQQAFAVVTGDVQTLSVADHLDVGTVAPVASQGTIRGPKVFSIGSLAADGSGAIAVASVDGADHVRYADGAATVNLGDDGASTSTTVAAAAGGSVALAIGGSTKLLVDDNGIKIKGTYVDPYRMTGVKTADYTASFGDFVECDPTAGGFTITLPDPTGNANRGLTVFNASNSTNAITISLTGKTINGTASYSLAAAWTAVTLISNGTNYYALPAAA